VPKFEMPSYANQVVAVLVERRICDPASKYYYKTCLFTCQLKH